MTMLGMLDLTRNSTLGRYFIGNKEDSDLLAAWFRLHVDNTEKANKILSIFKNLINIDEINKELYKFRSIVPNMYIDIQLLDEYIFIFNENLDGFPDRMLMMSSKQMLYAVNEYFHCLKIGLKNSEPILFEYEAEGDSAKVKYNALIENQAKN